MRFQTLVTTINKSREEVVKLLDESNIQGDVIVGNQCRRSSSYLLEGKKYSAHVIELIDYGASLNRNTVLELATADYVSFADDDAIFPDNYLEICKGAIRKIDGTVFNAVRLNVQSLNADRPIKQIDKDCVAKYKTVRSFGVWGILFQRKFLIDSSLRFNTNIGPGTKINHGEDSLFLSDFFRKKGKMLVLADKLYELKQDESSWLNENSLVNELICDGFIYGCIYPYAPYAASFCAALRRHKKYSRNLGFPSMIYLLFSGNSLYKAYEKRGYIDFEKMAEIESKFKKNQKE